MAIQFVGGRGPFVPASTGTTTDVSLVGLLGGLAGSAEAGDLVLVFYATGSNADRSIGVTTAGYTEVAELYANANIDTNLSFSWKIMGSTPDTVVTLSATGSTNDGGGATVLVYRGVDQTTPFDVAATTATGNGTGRPNPPAITPVTSGAVIVVCGAGGSSGNTASVYSATYLSNIVDRYYAGHTYDIAITTGDVAWTSGAYNPAAFARPADSAIWSWAAVTAALRPSTATNVSVSVTGVSASGETGPIVVSGKATAPLVGTTSEGFVGATELSADANTPVGLPSAAGAIGPLSVTGGVSVLAAGVAGTIFVGDVTYPEGGVAFATGVAATATSGSITVTGKATAIATGAPASALIGQASVSASTLASLTGIEASGAVGQATIVPIVRVSGLQADASVGDVVATGSAPVAVSGLLAEGSIGDAYAYTSVRLPVSLGQAAATVGSVTAKAGAIIALDGLLAHGYTSRLLVWGEIAPNQTPDYDPVDAGQVPVWSNINPVQAAGYVEIVPSENPGYSPVNPLQDVVWTPVKT